MQTFDGVQTSNDYTQPATLSEVWNSAGGYFVITVADVFMQLEYGEIGTQQWTNEVHVPVGNGILNQGTIGVRFRSYTSGTPATVTAALAGETEPAIVIGQPSTAHVTGSTVNVQHNDVLVAAEPTLDFEDGTGLAWTVTDDAPNTRVKLAAVARAATTVSPGGTYTNTSGSLLCLGADRTITPAVRGDVLFCYSGMLTLVGGQGTVAFYYGTGTPPVQGAAPAGGTSIAQIAPLAATQAPFGFAHVVTGLVVGTAYWYDIVTNTGGTSNKVEATFVSAAEL